MPAVHHDVYLPGHCIRSKLSRFLNNSRLQHWSAAIRVLRYFKTTHQHGIIHKSGTSSVSAEAYSDAEWGYNLDDRRSVSGVMIMIGNSPVVFKSKFQRTIALSSAEAGYMALKPMRLGSTVDACDADGHGNGTKERYYDLTIKAGTVALAYVDTKRQLADILTKALGPKTFKFLRDANGIQCKVTKQLR
ncbi:unnamed protein product [Peronospora belbahrii]|uniref:Uncharacterized protein n=1 Tax=Peronospora belbahrii TaxID=622444 RepID=A0AAU9KZ28_9STRA|nr:unnamed protein product [Peronospora belbahrii]